MVLKIKKEIQEILQSVGVRQGNNMAPVLFVFLMPAAAKTLEVKWRETGNWHCCPQSCALERQ